MELQEARELIANRQLWPLVRGYLAAGGEMKDFTRPENRLMLLDEPTRKRVALWLEALSKAAEWRKVVDGAKVRELKAAYPDIYPEVFRYLPYFSKFNLKDTSNVELVKALLKLKFPEIYELCVA